MARRLPKGLILLNVYDPRESFPQLVASLPAILQAMNAGRGPRGAAVPIEIKPDLIPPADELSKRLFPGSLAVAVDEQGLRVVSRDAFPTITSPATAGVLVGLFLPAVQAGREAARRAQCTNNLKQIGLALHNHHAANNRLPQAAIADKDGKPLLSWRVAILPFLGEQELYNRFKLDEPWDSPNNKALLQSMPQVYACPDLTNVDRTSTAYQVFTGNGSLMEVDKPTSFADVTDGTANTLAVVEGKKLVPWTKPEDLEFDPEKPAQLFGAGSPHPGGFNALFADGSVRFIKMSIDLQVFRALITRAGGEVINLNNN
jgi:prepilin-type processing-associated H-X9-DG protein